MPPIKRNRTERSEEWTSATANARQFRTDFGPKSSPQPELSKPEDMVRVKVDDGWTEVNQHVMTKLCDHHKFTGKVDLNLLDQKFVKIKGVTQCQMRTFYNFLQREYLSQIPPVCNTRDIIILLKLSDKFGSESVAQKMLQDDIFYSSAETKFQFLEAADECRNTILTETCVRLCGNIDLEMMKKLEESEVSLGTRYALAMFLAAVREQYSNRRVIVCEDEEDAENPNLLSYGHLSRIPIDTEMFFR